MSHHTNLLSVSLFFLLEIFLLMPNLSHLSCNLNPLFILLSTRENNSFPALSTAYLRNTITLPSPILNLLFFKEGSPSAVIPPGRLWFPALWSFLQLPSRSTAAGPYLSRITALQTVLPPLRHYLCWKHRHLFRMLYEFSVLSIAIVKGKRESALLQRAINYAFDWDPNRFSC